MRKGLGVFCGILLSLSSIEAHEYNDWLRIERLESQVEYLMEEVSVLAYRFDLLASQLKDEAPRTSLKITHVDTFFNKVHLSNGMKFYYFNGFEIGHWLTGQPVKLTLSETKGWTRIVNIETGDWIDAKRE